MYIAAVISSTFAIWSVKIQTWEQSQAAQHELMLYKIHVSFADVDERKELIPIQNCQVSRFVCHVFQRRPLLLQQLCNSGPRIQTQASISALIIDCKLWKTSLESFFGFGPPNFPSCNMPNFITFIYYWEKRGGKGVLKLFPSRY